MIMIKIVPFDEARYNQCAGNLERALRRLEQAVQAGNGKFLVSDELTMADIMVLGSLICAGKFLMDSEMLKAAPSVPGYLRGLLEIPEVGKAFGELKLCETRVR